MPKFINYFLVCAIFVIGVSIGTYLGLDKVKDTNLQNDDKSGESVIIPVQDVVIRNVQDEQEKEDESNVIPTVIEETKLSPYAKMKIEKKFTKCGHSSIEIIDIPDELINMTEREIMAKYENWEVRSFSSKEVYLYREIVANCDDHFVLKEKDGFLAVYNNVNDITFNLKEVTDIDISSLPSGDIENLKKGIYVYGQDELSSLIEDFNS